ncbi:F-box/kelch-repeat protein At3g23880-like [Lycium barbarum]|uniref:F-box/kelch-repeat protein At3g23880-like n=1 Tax=Lycium barbarum TaxID=112863 RepID=UPI00293F4210|nr:F-box/kelch-repeat protein At3g23880-like [Lycium barbarum]
MSNKKAQERLAINLPFDIIFSIFTRLPVQSLLRFESVSKSWNAILSEQIFKKAQLDQSKALGREKLMLQRITGHVEFRDLESCPEFSLMEEQLFPRFQCAEILCSCDGLILLKGFKDYKEYVLWNPSTREYRVLESCPYMNGCPKACGLCYDSNLDEYKVILMCSSFSVVYSSNKSCWTKKTSFPCPVQLFNNRCSEGISTGGCVFWSLNWSLINQYVDSSTSFIIYLDVKSDDVKKLSVPEFVGANGFFGLSSLNGCLCLYGGTYHYKELDIWTMEQDGWKWLMNVCNLPNICIRFVQDRKLLWRGKNGEILFYGQWNQQLCIYYPKTKQFVTVHSVADISEDSKNAMALICLDSSYF